MYQYFISFYCWIIFHCMDVPHLICPFSSWWIVVSLFFFFAIINNSGWTFSPSDLAVWLWWTFLYKFLCRHVFISFEYISRSGIIEPYDNSEDCRMFSRGAAPFYMPTTCIVIWLLDSGYELVTHFGFHLHFFDHYGHPLCAYSVQSLSHVQLFAASWTAACPTSLSVTNSWSLLKPMSIESVMRSNYLILCRPLLLPPSIIPSIRE